MIGNVINVIMIDKLYTFARSRCTGDDYGGGVSEDLRNVLGSLASTRLCVILYNTSIFFFHYLLLLAI